MPPPHGSCTPAPGFRRGSGSFPRPPSVRSSTATIHTNDASLKEALLEKPNNNGNGDSDRDDNDYVNSLHTISSQYNSTQDSSNISHFSYSSAGTMPSIGNISSQYGNHEHTIKNLLDEQTTK